MDKKMMKYLAIFVIALVIFVIFALISNFLTGGVKYSYPKIEEKMVAAAKKYVKDMPGIIDGATPNSATTISSLVLVEKGYLKDLSSLAKDDVMCAGEVIIYKTLDGVIDYSPNLRCGNMYESMSLANQVIKDNGGGVVSGDGLYQKVDGKFVTDYYDLSNGGSSNSFEYVFRGDNVDNYVKFDDNIYRIVAIDENNNLLLIFNSYLRKFLPWDDRYNSDIGKNYGVNDYEKNGLKSRAMEHVETFHDKTAILLNKEKYSDKVDHYLVGLDLCIGKRSVTDKDVSGRLECKNVLYDQNAGLLPAYYYMGASLDHSCTSIVAKECGNYNYFSAFEDSWWLLTANSEVSSEAYVVNKRVVSSESCRGKYGIRPIIKIGSRVLYSEGNGTLNNPYIVKYFDD